MGEQSAAATEQQISPGTDEERTLIVFAPRIDTALRQQVEGLRGITGQTVNDVGVEALTDWVAKKLADETIRDKAMAELDAEQRRLDAQRARIASVLGGGATGQAASLPDATGPTGPSGRQRKAASGADAS